MRPIGIAVAATVGIAATAAIAHAFCGFYVAGSNTKLFNDATQVVLMREGTRTVLSMQNDYKGPLEDFAMVVPVPVVLKESDVKVLDPGVFDRINSLSSPRLVEYWEENPCPPPEPDYSRYDKRRPMRMKMASKASMAPMAMDSGGGGGGGGYYEAEEKPRKAVRPELSSFSAYPQTVTANVPTQVTWSFGFSNQPYHDPTCTVDHGVGTV